MKDVISVRKSLNSKASHRHSLNSIPLQNFAAELQIECEADMDLSYFKEVLQKAQGANYGTGVREI
jgi:hypothetical protein